MPGTITNINTGIIANITRSNIISNPAAFNPNNAAEWEWIVEDYAPDDDTMSQEEGHAFMAGYVKDRDALFDALAYFVGFGVWDGVSRNKVLRYLPATHPRWPFMRVQSVSVKGMEFDGQFSILHPVAMVNRQKEPLYKRYRFDISYRQFEYDFRENDDVSTEWTRCITVDPEDLTDMIVVDGGLYKYKAPGDAALDNNPVNLNGPFLKAFAQRTGLLVTSYGLPANFLMDSSSIPTKFMAAKGKVNLTTFLGKPAGTMLLMDYQIQKKAQPILTQSAGSLLYGTTVRMHFGFTDPDRAIAGETLRGWQLVPARSGLGTLGWYGIVDTNTGAPLYPSYEMNDLLTAQSIA